MYVHKKDEIINIPTYYSRAFDDEFDYLNFNERFIHVSGFIHDYNLLAGNAYASSYTLYSYPHIL